MIPKILHSIWLGSEENRLPWHNEWTAVIPDATRMHWGDNDLKVFAEEINDRVGFIPDTTIVMISDIFRLMVLRDHGGVYLDHDYMIYKDFFPLLNTEAVLTYKDYYTADIRYAMGTTLPQLQTDWETYIDPNGFGRDVINNAFIAAEKGSSFINQCIDDMLAEFNKPIEERVPCWDWGNGGWILTDQALKYGIEPGIDTVVSGNITVLRSNILHTDGEYANHTHAYVHTGNKTFSYIEWFKHLT